MLITFPKTKIHSLQEFTVSTLSEWSTETLLNLLWWAILREQQMIISRYSMYTIWRAAQWTDLQKPKEIKSLKILRALRT